MDQQNDEIDENAENEVVIIEDRLSVSNTWKRKRANIWTYFTPEMKNQSKASCNFCKRVFSFKTSITNLKAHIANKHPSIKFSENKEKKSVADSTALIVEEVEIELKETNNNIDNIIEKVATQTTSSDSVSTPSIAPFTNFQEKNKENINSPAPKRRKHNMLQSTINLKNTKLDFTSKKELDEKLLKLITKDLQPFSIVEDIGFRSFTHSLNSAYILPSRKTLGNLLNIKYVEVYGNVKLALKSIKAVTLTTDCWTSCNNESFLAVTAHFLNENLEVKSYLLEVDSCNVNHTSQNLAIVLKRIVTDWEIDKKIFLCLSDNAANIKKAVLEDLKWKHLGCLAHTINLIVKDALGPAEELTTKAGNIVAYFKRSSIANTKLQFFQKQNNKVPKKLIQSVPTRWNSVFYMLQRLSELKEEVRASIAVLGKENLAMFSNEEFEIIDQLIQLLIPFENLTVNLSSETKATLSSVIPIANGLSDLYMQLNMENSFSPLAKTVLQNIIAAIGIRFKQIEASSTLLVSTFLDPRYKDVAFSNAATTEKAKNLVITNLTEILEEREKNLTKNNENSEQSILENNDLESNNLTIWKNFDSKVSKATTCPKKTSNRAKAIIELQRYLEESILHRNKDPLIWWRDHSFEYPLLSKVVELKFGTVSTSVPSERVFSKSGQVISNKRSRLKSNKVNEILFLNKNEI